MKCEICGKSPADGKTTLFRQNPKGVAGIWRCEAHAAPVEEDLAQVVAVVQNALRHPTVAPKTQTIIEKK